MTEETHSGTDITEYKMSVSEQDILDSQGGHMEAVTG